MDRPGGGPALLACPSPAACCPASVAHALAPALPASLGPPPLPSCHVPLHSPPLAQENISRKIYFCINVNKVSVSCVQLQPGLLHFCVISASRLHLFVPFSPRIMNLMQAKHLAHHKQN